MCCQGDWLAFTSYAPEGGYWDVAASVSAGLEDVNGSFRILVNATDCSSVGTSGESGTGDAVDLLGGAMSVGHTGTWETFVLVGKADVWVPAGSHRVLFCADSEWLNLDYLRIYTPDPTPAPTLAPTIAPTPSPVAPPSTADQFSWLYISVSRRLDVLVLRHNGMSI